MVHRLKEFFFQGLIGAMALLVGVGAGTNSSEARKYALLVGVSNYPNLQEKYQLLGPDNDVKLMNNVLQRLQVKKKHIRVLYSSNEQRPTRANIIAGLRDLIVKTTAKDFVYLYFAGHGSRQPARVGDTDEDDGLDEIFLPEDVGSWQDDIGTVEKSITDNEIHHLITQIRANGTFVWAVFDSCHSGTMLRSVSRIKWRKVDPSALGIPNNSSSRNRAGGLPSVLDRTAPPAPAASASSKSTKEPGGYVAFYAAQAHQLAPELQMPRHGTTKSSHGLFTYQLAQAMTGGEGMTYRQIGQSILQKYVRQGMRATTPLFEGTHLDAPMFGRTNKAARHQWPVRIRGSRNRTVFIPAGELQQIGKGTVFALLNNVSDRDEKAIGYARADNIDIFSAQLLPMAFGGQPVFDLADLPRSAYARVIKPHFQFSLRVARPSLSNAMTTRERRAVGAIDAMARKQRASNRPQGLRVEWVKAGAPADVYLVFSPSQTGARNIVDDRNPAKGCERNHLWFLDASGAMICTGSRANLSFKIGQPSVNFEANVQKAMGDWLSAIGKVRNLEQMVERFTGGRFARKIKIKLLVKRVGQSTEEVVDQSSRQPLLEGDAIRLEIDNTSSSPVDLTILFVDSSFGITTLFPTRGRTNRISANASLRSIGGKITHETLGLEGMIVVASKADSGTPVADFSYLSQKRLSRVKNVRSVGRPKYDANRQGAAIEDLFASAAFGKAARRAGATRSVAGRKKKPRTPFKSVAIKSLRWMVAE